MSVLHRLCILGSTGSIGVSTLDVVGRHPDRLSVYALTAHTRIEALAAQAATHHARVVVVPDDAARARFMAAWPSGQVLPEIRQGAQALADTAADPEVTAVMAAIVGAAGLPGALAAARAGKRVLLANKEALVAAGALFMGAVRTHGAQLLPIDSEHNAIFQCLPQTPDRSFAPAEPAPGVRRLLLTASGGPFRCTALSQLEHVTPDEACAHPNWRMGRKISVDSATMLNKGLEVIEAHWLFSMPVDRIQVVVHPQSVVHSMVEYDDGSVLAQLGQPDMRTPIAFGLGFPDRIHSGVGLLELTRLGHLDFEAPDLVRFPCLRLSLNALKQGQGACITLNAANEVAVEGFLNGRLRYTQIPAIIEQCLEDSAAGASTTPESLDEVLEIDSRTRRMAAQLCRQAA
ncbi:MAG TPA: 1-deoxy-D-xylulose-5-phosphate reductoisomerase [Castellaniella sp.]|uniref:1-deoxy-D-xylulose-5-phosphate reductoisomerase n=1 Tax=Castellaniella sp. TaxID=1955812 RepID=UPI002EF7C9DF